MAFIIGLISVVLGGLATLISANLGVGIVVGLGIFLLGSGALITLLAGISTNAIIAIIIFLTLFALLKKK